MPDRTEKLARFCGSNWSRIVMPCKDQTKCYRTFGGVRYMNECDVLEKQHFALIEKAKRLKIRHRVVKHPDGYGQLFVHPDDAARLYGEQ